MSDLDSSVVELHFPVRGHELPSNHGYGLYGSISRVVPSAHNAEWLGIHSIRGRRAGKGSIQISKEAKLRVRLPLLKVSALINLTGATLEIDGHHIQCGIPEIHQLSSASTLRSRLVVINIQQVKGRPLEADDFMAAVQRRLTELEIEAVPELETEQQGSSSSFARRVLKVKTAMLPGYGVLLHKLNESDSLRIQELGLGGKRRMGCGLFLPLKREA